MLLLARVSVARHQESTLSSNDFGRTHQASCFTGEQSPFRTGEIERTSRLPGNSFVKRSNVVPDLAPFPLPSGSRIVDCLGRGSFGPVYLVESKIGVCSAIKLLDPLYQIPNTPTLLREATIHAKAAASDPTGVIVKILDYNEDGRSPFIALEYVRGKAISELYSNPQKRRDLTDAESFHIRVAIYLKLIRAIWLPPTP